MKSEISRFLLFLFILSIFASLLSSFRSQDKIYAFADGGLASITENNSKASFILSSIKDYFEFLSSLISFSAETATGESIYSHIGMRLIPTVHLAIFSIIFGAGSGVFFSLYSLYRKSERIKDVFARISEVILSTPVFVFSILLLILFFYQLDLFPPGGYEFLNSYYVVLPGLALGMRVFARIYLFQVREVWSESKSSYTLLLLTRGYPWKHIVFKEIFRKVFPLTLIIIMLDFSSLVSGAMIVEEIFFFPGIGKSLFYSIKAMDTKLLATLLLYIGIVFYTMNRIATHWQSVLLGENKHES